MSIKTVKPNSGKYRQGYYNPIHPEKYRGDCTNIIYRSSWERKFMIYCDNTPNILKWSSESIHIPYINPITQTQYMYYPDFLLEMKINNEIKRVIIEIKPFKQTRQPELKSRKLRHLKEYNESMATYVVNVAKWQAALNFAKNNDCIFQLLTEQDTPLANK